MRMRITVEGKTYDVEVEMLDQAAPVGAPAASAPASALASAPAPVEGASGPAATGDLPSPLAGTVVRVAVAPGDSVKTDDTLLVLEAMKMESAVTAPGDGTVTEVMVAAGDSVKAGQALVKFS